MGTRHFRTWAVVTSAVLLMFVGNAAEAQRKVNKIITLISPAANVVIPQSNPATGCALSTYGYGYTITFDWNSAPLKNGHTYTLQLQHVGSAFPMVLDGLTTSTYILATCGFVIDSNLSNWYWTVSRVSANGAVAQVSEQRPFSFAPCRLPSGAACNAVPN
jgi:hypothetical protein